VYKNISSIIIEITPNDHTKKSSVKGSLFSLIFNIFLTKKRRGNPTQYGRKNNAGWAIIDLYISGKAKDPVKKIKNSI